MRRAALGCLRALGRVWCPRNQCLGCVVTPVTQVEHMRQLRWDGVGRAGRRQGEGQGLRGSRVTPMSGELREPAPGRNAQPGDGQSGVRSFAWLAGSSHAYRASSTHARTPAHAYMHAARRLQAAGGVPRR